MNLLAAVCLCTLASSYVMAEEPVEHRGTSDGVEQTRIYSLGNSGLVPIVPASTTLLASPYSLGGGSPLLATPYSLGGGFGGGFGFAGGFPGGFPNNGGFHNNNNFPGGYPNNNNNNFPGGYPNNNNNNYPGAGQSSSCRYWCKSPNNQYYCCEGQNQQIGGNGGNGGGNVGTKPGFCPPVRPSCPPTRIHGPPTQCSNDYSCSGNDKCCFDTCLQHHTCKPTQRGGGYGYDGGYGR